MDEKQLIIRRATLADAALIAELGARTFAAAFAADNTPEDMEHYLNSNFSEDRILEQLSDSSSTFLLAYEHDEIRGYAMLYAGEIPAAVTGPSPLELVRIYVEVGVKGQGYGSAIMQTCLEEAKRSGYGTIWLGVWSRNHRAIRFYEKWGFEKVGEQEFFLGSDMQNDFIMARAVEMAS